MTAAAQCYQVALKVARSSAVGPDDWDERDSVAGIAAVEAAAKLGDRDLVPFTVQVTRRRLIDQLRIQLGRIHRHPELTALGPDDGAVESDMTARVCLSELIDRLSGGDQRTRRILWRLAAGDTKREVAHAVGVDPSRISQILAQIRNDREVTQ